MNDVRCEPEETNLCVGFRLLREKVYEHFESGRHRRNRKICQEQERAGKVKYALVGWLIGLPLPIILILWFVNGCDF
jgi:hypothetical protein